MKSGGYRMVMDTLAAAHLPLLLPKGAIEHRGEKYQWKREIVNGDTILHLLPIEKEKPQRRATRKTASG